jgi:hypothetical protein
VVADDLVNESFIRLAATIRRPYRWIRRRGCTASFWW